MKLAERTNTPISDIERYEANSYLGASISKKIEVAEALKIDTSKCFQSISEDSSNPSVGAKLQKIDDLDLREFPIKEAVKRGWISNYNKKDYTKPFKNWLTESTGRFTTSAFHRKGQGIKLPADIPSIITWQARVLQLANLEIHNSEIPKFTGNDRWFRNFVNVTADISGPARVKDLLLQQGIILVIERHLPKTYLDGAALLSHDGIPIVALTLRYNRLDYFWFTLFHELAHVYLHLFSRHHFNFFDRKILNEGNQNAKPKEPEQDELEKEADRFALKKLIAPQVWEQCRSRQTAALLDIKSDAKKLNIHPSIIAGRIRKERDNYQILGSLLGQGDLHRHFGGYSK